MKNNILILLLIFILTCCKGDDKCVQLIDEPYIFPIVPGQVEWNELSTTEQRHKAVQIPEDILYCLSDEALIETCINYPLYIEYTLSSNSNAIKGFETMIRNFNGLEELFKRESALKIIIQKYLIEDMYKFANIYSKSRLSYYYMFLSKETTISKLNNNQRYKFIKITIERINTIENENPKVLCCDNVELSCYYIVANALYYFEFEPFVSYFVSTNYNNLGGIPPKKIYEYALIFLTQQK